MRGRENKETKGKRGDGEKSKAKQKEGRVDCKCERETVRWMDVELEEKRGAGVIVEKNMKICLNMVLAWHTPWKNLCEGSWDIRDSLSSMVTVVDLATV